MVATRAFAETVEARSARDPAFRQALLTEETNALMDLNPRSAKAVLRPELHDLGETEQPAVSAKTGEPS